MTSGGTRYLICSQVFTRRKGRQLSLVSLGELASSAETCPNNILPPSWWHPAIVFHLPLLSFCHQQQLLLGCWHSEVELQTEVRAAFEFPLCRLAPSSTHWKQCWQMFKNAHTGRACLLFQGLIGDLGWHFPTAWQGIVQMFVDGSFLPPHANLSSGKLASVGFVLTSWKSFPTSDDCVDLLGSFTASRQGLPF